MGRKRTGKGKPICLCLAALILVGLSACSFTKMIETKITGTSFFNSKEKDAREHLNAGRALFAQGDYGNATKEYEKVLGSSGSDQTAEALFFIGLISAYPANPAKDYGKSLLMLKKMVREHPHSPLVEQARTLIALVQDNEKLNRMIEQLNTVIEELKRVDIGVEQKRKEKSK